MRLSERDVDAAGAMAEFLLAVDAAFPVTSFPAEAKCRRCRRRLYVRDGRIEWHLNARGSAKCKGSGERVEEDAR